MAKGVYSSHACPELDAQVSTDKNSSHHNKNFGINSAKADNDKPSDENEKKYREEMRKVTNPELCKADAEQKVKYHELAKAHHSDAAYKGKLLTSLPEFEAVKGSFDTVCWSCLSAICFKRQRLSKKVLGEAKFSNNCSKPKFILGESDIDRTFKPYTNPDKARRRLKCFNFSHKHCNNHK